MTGEPVAVDAVWLTCQRPARLQRQGRYVRASARHPAKMLPDVAAYAIRAFTAPGDVVLDPMCGIGTTLVEAAWLGRDSIGIDVEEPFTRLARTNLALAAGAGRTATARVLTGDARRLPGLLPPSALGTVALVLTSPPYGRHTHGLVTVGRGERLTKQHFGYGDRTGGNLAYLGWEQLFAGWQRIVAGCVPLLRPGGMFVFTGRPVRMARDDLLDLPGELQRVAVAAGLQPVRRCVALLAAVRDGRLIHRASTFALLTARRARAAGVPVSVIAHEDVYILRKP